MVHINTFTRTLLAVAHVASTRQSSSGLSARQSISTSNLPPACQSGCQVLNALVNCGNNGTCICGGSMGTALVNCLDCLYVYSEESASFAQEAESLVTGWDETCNADLALNFTTSNSSGSSGSSSSGSTGSSSGALSLQAVSTGIFVVAAAVAAHLVL